MAIVSARALIMRLPTDRSLAQPGTRPQWNASSAADRASAAGVASSPAGVLAVGFGTGVVSITA